ncbi:MAG: DNA-binding protein [Pseudorhodoplanes sp.]
MSQVKLRSGQVRRRYGDISDMTLWRWLQDPELGFPQPEYIRGIRYWSEEELNSFDMRSRQTVAA